jgi:FkbM family methyltransferase
MIYLLRDEYEPELKLLPALTNTGDLVVDAGANYGIFAVILGGLVGEDGRVAAIEPAPEAAEVLRRNAALSGLSNLRVYEVGLSAIKGRGVLSPHRDPSQRSLAPVSGGTEIEVTRLDELVQQGYGDRDVAFVKIDVEGAEELVLQGFRTTLSRSRPSILLEVNPTAARELNLDPEGALHLLEEEGYLFYQVQADLPEVVVMDYPRAGNVLALPQEKAGHYISRIESVLAGDC